jgi:monofunctional glycosyltransferase
MKKSKKPKQSISKRILKLFIKIILVLFLISVLSVLLLRWIDPFTSSIMIQRKIDAIYSDKKNTDIHYEWFNYDEISEFMVLAVIASEDQNFPFHFGFDFEQIEKAIEAHKKGRRLRGASTITQQVAKNLFLWEGKSFVRKAFEAYFTVLIETLWSKKRIVEVYINIAETGDMIFGVGAASKIYFNKKPEKLSAAESALIAATLPNPKRYSVVKPGGYVMMRQGWILYQMNLLDGVNYLKNL